jgi:hypothetical protein
MGDLFVNISFTPPANNITKPTTRRAIVFLDDPARSVNYGKEKGQESG